MDPNYTIIPTQYRHVKSAHGVARHHLFGRGVLLAIAVVLAHPLVGAVTTVRAKVLVLRVGEADRPDVIRADHSEGEEPVRPGAVEDDAFVDGEEPLDVLREVPLHGEELSGKMNAVIDREEGGRVHAVVVGGREIQCYCINVVRRI